MPDERPETHPGRPADRIVVDLAVRLGFLGLFAWLALAILSPFVLILLWALFLTVALQPGHASLAARLGGRGRLAAVIVTLIGLAIVLGPISMLVASLVGSVETLSMGMAGGGLSIPPPPAEVKTIPIAGAWLHSNWELASSNLQGFLGRYGTTLIGAGKWVIRPAEALGLFPMDGSLAGVGVGEGAGQEQLAAEDRSLVVAPLGALDGAAQVDVIPVQAVVGVAQAGVAARGSGRRSIRGAASTT